MRCSPNELPNWRPRAFVHGFELPEWSREPADVFRIDAEIVYSVNWEMQVKRIVITDQASRDRIYVVARDKSTRISIIEQRSHGIRDRLRLLNTIENGLA